MGKLIVVIIILVLIIIFTIQNTEQLEIVFWPWKLTISKALLSLGALLCGLLAGILIGKIGKLKSKKEVEEK